MLTLLSTLISFLMSGTPKILEFFQDRSDKKHELDLARLQTERELQILRAVREDRRTQEIAETFGISPLTVKNHLRKVMAKLGARSRVHAVAEAMARQIIS